MQSGKAIAAAVFWCRLNDIIKFDFLILVYSMAIVDITHNQNCIGNSAIAVYRHFKQRLSIKNSYCLG
jgi:hypothetical protein